MQDPKDGSLNETKRLCPKNANEYFLYDFSSNFVLQNFSTILVWFGLVLMAYQRLLVIYYQIYFYAYKQFFFKQFNLD